MPPSNQPAPRQPLGRAARLLPALACAALALGCSVRVGGGGPAHRRAAAPAPPTPAPAAPPAAPAPGPAPRGWAHDAPQPDPDASRLFLMRARQPGGALSRTAAPPRVTALALAATARGEVQGMIPDGGPQRADLKEGERATVAVTLAPTECAAFVAQGGLGVVEVDLFLTRGAPPAIEVLAQDVQVGPVAVIGGRGACFRNTGRTPLAAELHAQVRRGGGVVLVQGYRAAAGDGRGATPAP